MSAQDVGGAAHEAAGKVGKPQVAVEFEGQRHQRLRPAAVLFGLMKIAGHLEGDRNLSRQGPGATDVLLRNAGAVEPIQNSEHAQHFAFGIEQRDGQELPHLELAQHFQVGSGDFGGVVGPEDFLVEQGSGWRARRET